MSLIPNHNVILHGGDYNPDQWLGALNVIGEDLELINKSGCNTFTLGVFAWTSYEQSEGHYTFGWLDRIMDALAEAGHRVILATPSGARPAWLARKYSEVRRVNSEGRREPFQHRHNHCWQSPVYREKVRAVNERLVERYANHPALGMWHISNELSGDCYCDLCLKRWWEWLEERYQTLNALNSAWWTAFWSHTFTEWEEIDPRATSLDGLSLDWRRFNTSQLVEWYRFEADPIREKTPDIPITTNFMGLYPHTNYAELAGEVDLVADDQYPEYDPEAEDLVERAVRVSFKDDLFRTYREGRPWMIMECAPDAIQWRPHYRFKPPALHRAEVLQALGHGAEGICYFQWRKGRGAHEKLHSAVVDHVGTGDTRVFRQVRETSRTFDKLKVLLGSTVCPAQVAVVFDWECWWAFNCSCGTPSRNQFYLETAVRYYRPWWELGIPVDGIPADADFRKYKVLILPQTWMLKDGFAERLEEFVREGGTAIMSFNSAVCNETNLCLQGGMPCSGLGEVFGIWVEEGESLPPGIKRVVEPRDRALFPDGPCSAENFASIVHPEGAEVLATYGNAFYRGTACLTRHAYGQGEAWYIGTDVEDKLLLEIGKAAASRAGVRSAVPVSKPPGVASQVRRQGNQSFILLQNFNDTEKVVLLDETVLEDCETGQIFQQSLKLDGFASGVYSCI